MRAEFGLRVALIALSALMADATYAQVLTGAERAQFIAGATDSCVRGRDKDPEMQIIPAPYFARYCSCYAAGLADRASWTDLRNDNQRVLAPIINEVSKACYAMIKAAAMQELQNRNQ